MSASKSQPQTYLDRAAMWLSGLCLVHCLALPLAVLLTPTLSQWLEATETTTHWILFGIAIPISVIALVQGYRRLRGSKDAITWRHRIAIDAGCREPCFWSRNGSSTYRHRCDCSAVCAST